MYNKIVNFLLLLVGNYKKLEIVNLPKFSIDPSFSDHYTTHILPKIFNLELKRADAVVKFRKRLLISLFVGLPLLIVCILYAEFRPTYRNNYGWNWDTTNFNWIFGFGLIGIPLFLIFWASRPINNYIEPHKFDLLNEVVKFFGPEGKLSKTRSTSIDVFNASKLITKWDSYVFDSHFICLKYKNVPIEISNVSFSRATEASGEQGTSIVSEAAAAFYGSYILLTLNRNFKGVTMGQQANIFNRWRNFYGDLKKIEHKNKKFRFYSSNIEESSELLSEDFLKKIDVLRQLYSGKIRFSFFENKILLMFGGWKNWFQPTSILMPSSSPVTRDINFVVLQMKILFEIIDDLDKL